MTSFGRQRTRPHRTSPAHRPHSPLPPPRLCPTLSTTPTPRPCPTLSTTPPPTCPSQTRGLRSLRVTGYRGAWKFSVSRLESLHSPVRAVSWAPSVSWLLSSWAALPSALCAQRNRLWARGQVNGCEEAGGGRQAALGPADSFKPHPDQTRCVSPAHVYF